jgi:hypothetical protein
MLALEHAKLLTQRQDFQPQTISEAQEGTQPPKKTYDEFEEEVKLHGPSVISKVFPKPLISQGDRFLATHRSNPVDQSRITQTLASGKSRRLEAA